MLHIDEPLDWLRVINILLSLVVLVLLVGGILRFGDRYNTKTRDYWYGRFTWTLTGLIISFEGVRRDFPFTVIPLCVFAATLVTLKGILQRGPWGYDRD